MKNAGFLKINYFSSAIFQLLYNIISVSTPDKATRLLRISSNHSFADTAEKKADRFCKRRYHKVWDTRGTELYLDYSPRTIRPGAGCTKSKIKFLLRYGKYPGPAPISVPVINGWKLAVLARLQNSLIGDWFISPLLLRATGLHEIRFAQCSFKQMLYPYESPSANSKLESGEKRFFTRPQDWVNQSLTFRFK